MEGQVMLQQRPDISHNAITQMAVAASRACMDKWEQRPFDITHQVYISPVSSTFLAVISTSPTASIFALIPATLPIYFICLFFEGGRRRSPFFYDIWNIRYLSKFKWDDLTEEIAFKSATREQKLALEISAAKRERNYTLSKFAQARALNSIQERLKKKQRTEDSESSGKAKVDQQETKIFRRFPQNKPVNNSNQKTGILSEDILARV
ncbi:hypothetical protein Taro_011337 [Colocasia esculenta]|uniref:Uncharacterized protein n=1 Tax=Colocasia esculenta TaxID=4460 RepID=A0A843UFT7_COLES|nr:hypothetical protein [Colocasia esculenta]